MNALRPVLARQGTVVAAWRTYRGTRLGPYYRLAYRQHGCRRSLYLGRSSRLVRKVRKLLAEWQGPLSQHRQWTRLYRCVRASLRAHKVQWAAELARAGLHLKGYDIRGLRRLSTWARAAPIVASSSTPTTNPEP